MYYLLHCGFGTFAFDYLDDLFDFADSECDYGYTYEEVSEEVYMQYASDD